jgi:hypothetical protein
VKPQSKDKASWACTDNQNIRFGFHVGKSSEGI